MGIFSVGENISNVNMDLFTLYYLFCKRDGCWNAGLCGLGEGMRDFWFTGEHFFKLLDDAHSRS